MEAKSRRVAALARGAVIAVVVVLMACAGLAYAAVRPPTETRGPEGQIPIWYDEIKLTDAEKEQIRRGNYVIGYDKLAASEFDDTIGRAMEWYAEQLNMRYIETFNRLDAAVQKENVENLLAAGAKAIAAVSVDPVVSGEAFRSASNRGVGVVFASNKAPLKWGTDYTGALVFYDLAGFGPVLAEALNGALKGKGEIGYVYHEANFFITNQRDQGFRKALAKYPGLRVVDERPWSGNPADAEAVVAAMITAHPEIDGIYLPWQEAVMPAIAALRAAGRQSVKIVSNDVGEITALEMARGDNIVMLTQCEAWQYGVTATEVAAYVLLKKKIPAEAIMVPGHGVTRANLREVWPKLFNTALPKTIDEALRKRGL